MSKQKRPTHFDKHGRPSRDGLYDGNGVHFFKRGRLVDAREAGWSKERVEAQRAQNVRLGKPPYAGIPGFWPPERRAAHGKLVSAAMKKKHAVRRRDVDAFLETAEVHESLKPLLEMRSKQATAIVEDLGGTENVSTTQICAIDGWLRSQVAADALMSRFLQNPGPTKDAEKFSTLQALTLRHLAVIGVTPLKVAEAESLHTIATEIDEAKSSK